MPEPELVLDLSALAGRWNRHADLEALVRAVPQVKQGGDAVVGPFLVQRSANLVEVMPRVPSEPQHGVVKLRRGERVFSTDDGFLGPDDDTIREIADAVNERDKLKAECDRLRTAYADLWRAVKRIEADSRLGLGTGLEVASSALHYVHTYASSAIRAAEKKGFAPEIGEEQK